TPGGGHSTPSERASLSPSGSAGRWPVVVPSGTFSPAFGRGCIGAQFAARWGDGGAVWAGGVAGPGGACATAMSAAAIVMHARTSARFVAIQENGERCRRFRGRSVAFAEASSTRLD